MEIAPPYRSFVVASAWLAVCLGACAQPSPAASPTVSAKATTVVWDGDTVGFRARGWASCSSKPACTTSVGARKGAGADGGSAILFHADGAGWLGFGWNWVGYHGVAPAFTSLRGRPAAFELGTDVADYSNLDFRLRLVATGDVDVGSLRVGIGSAAARKRSKMLPLAQYTQENLADGKWHAFSIPLANLRAGAGAAFDPHSAWEFELNSNTAAERAFDLYVDDIAFDDKRTQPRL